MDVSIAFNSSKWCGDKDRPSRPSHCSWEALDPHEGPGASRWLCHVEELHRHWIVSIETHVSAAFVQHLMNLCVFWIHDIYMTFTWHVSGFHPSTAEIFVVFIPPPESDPIDGCCPRNPMKERFLHACLGAEGHHKNKMARKRNIGRSKGDRINICIRLRYMYVCTYIIFVHI